MQEVVVVGKDRSSRFLVFVVLSPSFRRGAAGALNNFHEKKAKKLEHTANHPTFSEKEEEKNTSSRLLYALALRN